jgi:hypothetical protein
VLDRDVSTLHEAYEEITMAQSVIHLTQSRFYSPAFNAAVFDGPIRIYFAQHQETTALKVYFMLQQYLKETYSIFRKNFKQHGQTVFLMLYPTVESFENSFNKGILDNVITERLGEDHVVGVKGPLDDGQFEELFANVKSILQDLPLLQESASPSA